MTSDTTTDPNHGEPYRGVERRLRAPVLGMRFRDLDENGAANYMLQTPRSTDEGLGVFVTPNIQHIALARKDDEFHRALASAQIIVADGFPVYRFAKLRGLSLPGRVAGRAVIERMFADPAALAGHRGFFVVDSRATAEGIERWLKDFAPAFAVETLVPPFGFEKDAAYCRSLADAISTFGATLIFLCVGAPKSELFAYRYRALLPPAWALCVGQSFRLLLGMNAPPPDLMVRLNLEWLWRIVLEPRRMLQRYGPSTIGFLRAAVADLRQSR